MKTLRFLASCAAILPVTMLAADPLVEGTVSVGGGYARVDGDIPAYQQMTQQNADGFGGVEELKYFRSGTDADFRLETRLLPGNHDYRIGLRFEKAGKLYVDAGFEEFRVWYDGSAGYFRPTGTFFVLYDEELFVDRRQGWLEFGAHLPKEALFTFRYEIRQRDGRKNSTHWGDTNLVGAFGTRAVVPTFWDIDETTHAFTAELASETKEDTKWQVEARYSETKLNNSRNIRRRPNETADRIVTSNDGTQTDLFAAHGYYQRKVGEKLTLSAGALRMDIDTTLAGSRIYGQTYDPVFDPNYVGRQARDEGFYNLSGHSDFRQTVLNANAVYLPHKRWSIRPSVRYENLHQKTISEFTETAVGTGAALPMTQEEVEAESQKHWDEWAESLVVTFTGWRDWTLTASGDWIQGAGDLEEERVLHTGVITIDRDSKNRRTSRKYALKTIWYAKPGITFALQYYRKQNGNDYDTVRDNTPAGTADRYPAYITAQDFKTDDFNARLTWRLVPQLNSITRYDYQKSTIHSTEAGLSRVLSSKLESHILSQTLTWTPLNRLFVTGNVNLTWDQLATPAYVFVLNSDNNYVNGLVGGGYALAQKDDVYFDYAWFRADNFVDNSAVSLPYGVDQKQQTATLTWVRRQSEHLIYTFKLGYVMQRDRTNVNLNDFDATIAYAKVQYRF